MKEKTRLALTFIRSIVLALPEVVEQLCFDTPAFYVNKKLFARLREGEEELVIHSLERESWMAKDPRTFYITDHYLNYKYMLINLESVEPEVLKSLLITAWQNRAPKKLLKYIEK